MEKLKEANYIFLTDQIFSLGTDDYKGFEKSALTCFHHQFNHCPVYRDFVFALKIDPGINSLEKIPFLPISFFKTKEVVTQNHLPQQKTVFTSSGTGQQGISKHIVSDLPLYERSFLQSFTRTYGPIHDLCVLALLPNYQERKGSSLVYMAKKLIELSKHPLSHFHLENFPALAEKLDMLKAQKQKTLLLGVSYALLDLAESGIKLNDNFIVMETGGMKGKRKELLKTELHSVLKEKFAVSQVHSEYGMTELLSQAYSPKNGLFQSPPWLKILIRDMNDPFSYVPPGKTGGINIIDLANINSCCFISTQDLGRSYPDGSFELMGRFDNSDTRGCNLMID